MTIIKPRICLFPTFFADFFTGADWECSHAAKPALLPSLQMDRLAHDLDHNLPSCNRNVTISDHAVFFIVSGGITKAMNNPFHLHLALHKSHNSAVSLQERTELSFNKNLKEKLWKICVFQN